MTEEDAQGGLIARCTQGDREAFDELVHDFQPRIYALVAYMAPGQDQDWRADTVAEVMIQIHRTISTFRGNSPFGGWVYGVCTNVCLARLRQDRRRKSGVGPLVADPQGSEGHEEAVLEKVRWEKLYQEVLRLSLRFRLVFALRCVTDCSYREIGEILGIPEGTARSRMYEAKKRLLTMIPPGFWEDDNGI